MKQYKIIRLAGMNYDEPKVEFYKRNPDVELKSYYEQQKILFQYAYNYTDCFSKSMEKLGHQAEEIVYDLEGLQKTWAREKGVMFDPQNWQTEIILKQIEDIRPDVVYFQDIHSLPYSVRKNLKSDFPFIKRIVVFRGYPAMDTKTIHELADCDLLLVGSPVLFDKCQQEGIKAHLVYHSFDDTILEKIDNNGSFNEAPKHDFTFVGSSGYGYCRGHMSRYWDLVQLIQKTNISLWVHDKSDENPNLRKLKGFVRNSLKEIVNRCDGSTIEKFKKSPFVPQKIRNVMDDIAETEKQNGIPREPLCEMFPSRTKAPVFGIDMYDVLHQSKITYNRHSNPAGNTVDNIRLFQATGVGACLLTDSGTNMSDLFVEDEEIVTYSSIEECIEKANYLLSHDDERRKIAKAGQEKTLKYHTALDRCHRVDEFLQKML